MRSDSAPPFRPANAKLPSAAVDWTGFGESPPAGAAPPETNRLEPCVICTRAPSTGRFEAESMTFPVTRPPDWSTIWPSSRVSPSTTFTLGTVVAENCGARM
jgi:hypothetical protein